MRINRARLAETMDAFGRIGETPLGGLSRVALTDDDRRGRDLLVGWMKLSNGVVVDMDGELVAQTTGKITVEFDRSDDELIITRNGQTVFYPNFYTDFGSAHPNSPLVISLGCVTANGNISFPGSKARIDNFEFNGFKRARP